MRQLLQENPKLVKEKSKKGNTALQIALCSTWPEIAKVLIEFGSDVNKRTPGYTRTPCLRLAVTAYGKGLIELMLEKGAQPNVSADDGYTPLSVALNYLLWRKNDLGKEMVQALLDAGADPDLRGKRGCNNESAREVLKRSRADLDEEKFPASLKKWILKRIPISD